MNDRTLEISLTVNGARVQERVEARKTLVDFLREDLALTGSHVGCEHGVCGACTVRVNGEIVRGCLMLAVQCDGATVDTIEGLSDSGEVSDLQTAFEQRNYRKDVVQIALGDLGHKTATPRFVAQQPFGREHLERLAQRRARDLEPLAQRGLVEKAARGQRAGEDLLAQRGSDLVVQ